MSRATTLKKQLVARWAVDRLIEEVISQFRWHNNRAIVPTKLKDMSQLIMPKSKWTSPQELAIQFLSCFSPWLIPSHLQNLYHTRLQKINELQIEEAIIDEGMLRKSTESVKACIQSEFKKIHRVITKAQNLRLKAVEMAVRELLSQTEAVDCLSRKLVLPSSYAAQIEQKFRFWKNNFTQLSV
uniref:Uncharacterized protein n=1 Tax=Nicotiana tabacum TaxID=4097 RepID=A0A1S4DKD7_TOBAC|nr:PREDICTED: uncharacterized protein LOC107830726 [Nicotiana tabacum]